MKKALTITDVTRMRQGRVCIAGYDADLRCVRPVLPYPGIDESTLCARGSPAVFPFAQVEFDLREMVCAPPHIEDCRYRSGSPRFIRRLDGGEAQALLDRTSFKSVHDIFGAPLRHDIGLSIMEGEGDRSLGTIRPKKLLDVVYEAAREGRWRYRLRFLDGADAVCWLTVTDLTWRYYCDHRRLVDHCTTAEVRSELLAALTGADSLYLRLGLTRGWERHPDRHFVQITGVYPFPDYAGGRTHAELAPQPVAALSGTTSQPAESVGAGLGSRLGRSPGGSGRPAAGVPAATAPADQLLYAPARRKSEPAPQAVCEGELYEALRSYRREIAPVARWRLAFVLWNHVLAAIARSMPRTLVELEAVEGVGPRTVEWFGQDILSVVARYAPDAQDTQDTQYLSHPRPPVVIEAAGPRPEAAVPVYVTAGPAGSPGPAPTPALEAQPATCRSVVIDPDLHAGLAAEAQRRGMVIETLANLWLAERLYVGAQRPGEPVEPAHD